MSRRQFAFENGAWRDVINDCPAIETATFLGYGLVEAIAMDGWCGCGSPEVVIDALAAYLGQDGDLLSFPDELSAWLVAYRADELGLTEHGGVITVAWLTDAGRSWLELVQFGAEPEENE